MKFTPTGIGIFIALFLLTIVGMDLYISACDQQRQINQLCQATVALAKAQGAEDGSGFRMDKGYCFFFADYSRGIAIIGEFDGEICYNKKPRIIIMHGIKEELLQGWDKAELCYGYKKIR